MRRETFIFRASGSFEDTAAAILLVELDQVVPGVALAVATAMARQDNALNILSIDGRGNVDCTRVPKAAFTMGVKTLGDHVRPLVEAMKQQAKRDMINHVIGEIIALEEMKRFKPNHFNINAMSQELGFTFPDFIGKPGNTNMDLRLLGQQSQQKITKTRIVIG